MSIHFSHGLHDLSGTHEVTQQGLRGVYRSHVKRWLEVSLIVVTSIVTLPLIGVLAGLVALDGGSPIFRQNRVGMNGRVFRMLKLRTMVLNAEEELQAYLEANPRARAEWDATQKLKKDPRVTWIGRFLRRTSLDELPQLWNVFRGEMSLVGPRPMMLSQRALYPGTAYYALRPGITGPWQVSDRNDCEFSQRAQFDADYHHGLSLFGDMAILLRTVRVVLRATGY